MKATLRQLVLDNRFRVDDAIMQETLVNRAADILRMKAALEIAGYCATDEDIAAAWISHSDRLSASWLLLPERDLKLIVDLLGGPTSPWMSGRSTARRWKATFTDAADGSGDQLLELPDDLTHTLGWRIGDALEITRSSAGEIRIRKIVTA